MQLTGSNDDDVCAYVYVLFVQWWWKQARNESAVRSCVVVSCELSE